MLHPSSGLVSRLPRLFPFVFPVICEAINCGVVSTECRVGLLCYKWILTRCYNKARYSVITGKVPANRNNDTRINWNIKFCIIVVFFSTYHFRKEEQKIWFIEGRDGMIMFKVRQSKSCFDFTIKISSLAGRLRCGLLRDACRAINSLQTNTGPTTPTLNGWFIGETKQFSRIISLSQIDLSDWRRVPSWGKVSGWRRSWWRVCCYNLFSAGGMFGERRDTTRSSEERADSLRQSRRPGRTQTFD